MKILNSLLLSLFTIALVSTFLTSCEKNVSVETLNEEALEQKVLNPEVAASIKDVDLLPKEAFDSAPTYLPTDVEIEEMRINQRSNSTDCEDLVDVVCYIPFTYYHNGTCEWAIGHSADWNVGYGCCPESNWTWYNMQKKRANGNFTTEHSGLKYGDYSRFTPEFNLTSGEYLSAIFAWNQCTGNWDLMVEWGPQTPCN